MKKRLLAIVMAISLVTAGSVYAEEQEAEETAQGQEESSEDSGDSEDREDAGSEDTASDDTDAARDEEEGPDGTVRDEGSQAGSSQDEISDEGAAQETDITDDGLSDPVDDVPYQEDAGRDGDVPAGGDAFFEDVYGDNADEGYMADVENGELPVIIKLVEDGSVPEGTILAEYEALDDHGNMVLIREIATAPVVPVSGEEEFDLLDHFGLAASGADAPTIDNGGWEGVPSSWEYNWDNTDSATKWGMWGGNGDLKGYVASSIEDLHVRHRMQMYCDGTNVHLLITYASIFDNPGNGDDYNFYIDGEHVKFKVVYDDDAQLTEARDPGTYTLKVLHEDDSVSSKDVMGGYGTMTVNRGQLNNMTEICIPISEMVRQNGNINPDSFSMIEFYTPNLMYRRMATSGASSGPIVFALITVAFFGGAYYRMRKRRGGDCDLAWAVG